MTTVGHTFTAFALASVSVPRARSLRWKSAWIAVFGSVSNLPDFPLPGWGHGSYAISHSLFVALAVLAVFGAIALRFGAPRGLATRTVVAFVAVAWLSHLLLDALYNHGQGIAIFWPVSDAHLALPLPWFSTLQLPVLSPHNRDVLLTEAAVYGVVLVAALWARYRWLQPEHPGRL